ncbi:MAG: hypothetical protein DMG73_06735 [Acidobacteria bacterium]|nr:MAG: hypothetical protein DMG75_10515 [Acidobacteriota bacterium]PYX60271.1 MAG: hypothetical protein DMG73_06735 [Acidobacteriota bacterium]PYX63758.1 MAG: hypothetical protein DMG74_15755 [Acidobacteriota bacterium]
MAQPLTKTPEPFTNQEPITHPAASDGPKLISGSIRARAEEYTPEWKQTAEAKLQEVKQRASQALGQAEESISAAYDQVKIRTADTFQDVKRKSVDAVEKARFRARYLSHEYPLHVIAGAAGIAFLLGVGLRIWRSNRYE